MRTVPVSGGFDNTRIILLKPVEMAYDIYYYLYNRS